MSFDYTDLDELISTLEKKLSPGSPPVMENGKLVLWRTIRGFRTALELHPGDGRYEFGGKKYKGGKVLVGPPSLVGQDINNVDQTVWAGLSGTGTKTNFSETQTPEGIKSLKESIANSIKQDDTRHKAIKEATTTAQLVQLARSAGFRDDEIKQALDGKVFQNALGGDDKAPKDNVIQFPKGGKNTPAVDQPDEPETPDVEEPVAAGAEDMPKPPKLPAAKPPKPDNSGSKDQLPMAAGAEDMAPLIDALKVPGILNADKKARMADALEAAAQKLKDEFLRKQVEGYANGLRTGDFKLEQVREELKRILNHRAKSVISKLSDEDLDRLHDKAKAKQAVKEVQEHAEKAEAKPYTAEEAAADRYFYEKKLEELAAAIKDSAVAEQVTVLREQIKTRRLGGNSVILRLLQILRFLLAFIPGL